MKRVLKNTIKLCILAFVVLLLKTPNAHAEVVGATLAVQNSGPTGAWQYMGDSLSAQACYYTLPGKSQPELSIWIMNTNPDYHYYGTIVGSGIDGWVSYDIDKHYGLTHRTLGRWDNPGVISFSFSYWKGLHEGDHCGPGYCRLCGGYVNVPHNWVNSNTQASPATCTRPSYYYKKCSKCGALGATYPVGNPLGHQNKWVVDTDLTCTQNMTGHLHCYNPSHNTSVDGPLNTLNGFVLKSAPGHHFEELVSDTKATCTEEGKSHYVCTNTINGVRCRETNSVKGNFKTADSSTFTVQPYGHYITKDAVANRPTVYSNGTREYYCENCGEKVTDREIQSRHFNMYVGNKRVIKVLSGDRIVWGGSYGEQGVDDYKTDDDTKTLTEDYWYYKDAQVNDSLAATGQ